MWTVIDNGEEAAKFGARFVGKQMGFNGMVLRETYPSNDLNVIQERIMRADGTL